MKYFVNKTMFIKTLPLHWLMNLSNKKIKLFIDLYALFSFITQWQSFPDLHCCLHWSLWTQGSKIRKLLTTIILWFLLGLMFYDSVSLCSFIPWTVHSWPRTKSKYHTIHYSLIMVWHGNGMYECYFSKLRYGCF